MDRLASWAPMETLSKLVNRGSFRQGAGLLPEGWRSRPAEAPASGRGLFEDAGIVVLGHLVTVLIKGLHLESNEPAAP